MTRIVALSDTHNQQFSVQLPEGDILIHAGDLTGTGSIYQFLHVAEWFKEQKDKFKHRIMIGGNHDFGLQNNKGAILSLFDPDVIYLEDRAITIDGIKIYGSPYTPEFNNWAFMRKDEELARHWDNIPDDVDVLVTHGPPYSILDTTQEGLNVGSKTLYDRIKQLKKLKHHIFGHIHESHGDITIDDVQFHNVSLVNRAYKLLNVPRVIDIYPEQDQVDLGGC
jgi:Icc-related predicted phosphoesterase